MLLRRGRISLGLEALGSVPNYDFLAFHPSIFSFVFLASGLMTYSGYTVCVVCLL